MPTWTSGKLRPFSIRSAFGLPDVQETSTVGTATASSFAAVEPLQPQPQPQAPQAPQAQPQPQTQARHVEAIYMPETHKTVQYVYVDNSSCKKCSCTRCVRNEHKQELLVWAIAVIIILLVMRMMNSTK
jgi:hypothetical protein